MPYDAPKFDAIRTRALREIRSLAADADVTSDSDNFVRASSTSAIAEGIHQQGSWTARQIFPDTADFDELKRHAATRGVYPKSATVAGSSIAVSGSPGVPLPMGSQVRLIATGTVLFTTATVPIGSGGTGIAPVSTAEKGASLNGLEGAAVLTSPPLGIDGGCTLAALIGGTDDEIQESLLGRYLDVLRFPPSGGSIADYRRWALSVDGVSTALIIPKRRGGNSIDVVITSAGSPSSAAVIAACQAYIETVAPAGADIWVITPAVITVDVRVRLKLQTGFSLVDLQEPSESAAAGVIDPLVPLETLYILRLTAAFSSLAGVIDLQLVTPANNISASDDPSIISWIRVGTVTLEAMA
ncbi:baseplate J/gp47 family protein [Pseudomonas violetae]|uniref:Baseplate J/gp47 family protein n=1 Tax=Pseudomonas violetae TaxID=2915813 RepID=A0ABT0F0D8_9PSED|nr:baseplate J/gp47 family protein [Pseudomonas violetae]MCK1791157.1 baseplate J/gp47 family protein [Pseudomonas violetae]